MSSEPPNPRSSLAVPNPELCPSLGVQLLRKSVLPPEPLRPWIRRFAPVFQINVGNGCNQSCVHCTLDREGLFRTSAEEARSLVTAATTLGFDACSLVGGEPTVWPHLFTTLSFLQRQKVRRTLLNTNGLMLSYGRYLPRLEESSVDTILCSLDDPDPNLQRQLSRRDDTPELLDVAIDNLSVSPIHTAFYTVLLKTLDGRLDLYVQHMLRTADAFRTPPALVLAPLRHREMHSLEFLPYAWRYTDMMRQLRPAVEALSPYLPVMLRGFPLCIVEDLFSHCMDVYIETQLLDSASGAAQLQPPQASIPACTGCPKQDICPGVPPSYALKYGVQEFSPLRLRMF